MDYQSFVPVTMNLVKTGFTNGTGSSFSFTANPLNYAIRGKFYTKATQTNTAVPSTDAITGLAFVTVPAGTSTSANGCIFIWGYDAAGNIKCAQSAIAPLELVADGSTAASKFLGLAPQLPNFPDTICPIAYSVVKVGTSGGVFTLGTTSLASGSNIGVAHQDLASYPDRPQVA